MKMMNGEKNILVLGASGTVGKAVVRVLGKHTRWKITGTFWTHPGSEKSFENQSEHCIQDHQKTSGCSMVYFALNQPGRLEELLEQVCPDVIVSALRGDFDKQLAVHRGAADFLKRRGGRMIFLSTANVFDGSTDSVHYETDPMNSVSVYGKYKIACEKLLTEHMSDQLAILRLPFVWGRNSPRFLQVHNGCREGYLEVYEGLKSNHTTDLQVAEYTEWIIEQEKSGIYHVGTSEVVLYSDFIRRMICQLGWQMPEFQKTEAPETMAVLTLREDLPGYLKWTTSDLLEYLAGKNGDRRAGDSDAGRKTDEIRKTVIGTVKICSDLPYPCVPAPEVKEENEEIRWIVTASHRFRLHGVPQNRKSESAGPIGGKSEQSERRQADPEDVCLDLTPVVYQSCMHPEQIRIYPVELEFTDGKITFRIRDRQWTIPENAAASVEISDWKAALEKKSCVPCTNCGKCSW